MHAPSLRHSQAIPLSSAQFCQCYQKEREGGSKSVFAMAVTKIWTCNKTFMDFYQKITKLSEEASQNVNFLRLCKLKDSQFTLPPKYKESCPL